MKSEHKFNPIKAEVENNTLKMCTQICRLIKWHFTAYRSNKTLLNLAEAHGITFQSVTPELTFKAKSQLWVGHPRQFAERISHSIKRVGQQDT